MSKPESNAATDATDATDEPNASARSEPRPDSPLKRDPAHDAAPRTGGAKEQVKIWEEEGGSPPDQIASTKSTRPKTRPGDGAM